MESAKHGLDDRTKLNASFFNYFDQITASKASGNKSNLAGSVPRPLNGPHREDRICPRFWGQSKLLSGPLNNTQLRAGFLIFRAETLDEVQAMISAAPFAREGLIAQLDIQQWDPLFGQIDRYSSHNTASKLQDLID
ncbi:YciI family protein [Prodigiosinella aquatilis]|nr:YciI family protein [Prodigiosinella sp. LS101]WJV53866.1 YciI family protein [Prodigiosinella sp. LS101]WJV58228.1 YciI family protein [Pectobacteriaceae bacterium C111]